MKHCHLLFHDSRSRHKLFSCFLPNLSPVIHILLYLILTHSQILWNKNFVFTTIEISLKRSMVLGFKHCLVVLFLVWAVMSRMTDVTFLYGVLLYAGLVTCTAAVVNHMIQWWPSMTVLDISISRQPTSNIRCNFWNTCCCYGQGNWMFDSI